MCTTGTVGTGGRTSAWTLAYVARVAGVESSAKRRLDLTLAGRGGQVQQPHILDVGPLAMRPA